MRADKRKISNTLPITICLCSVIAILSLAAWWQYKIVSDGTQAVREVRRSIAKSFECDIRLDNGVLMPIEESKLILAMIAK